MPNAEVSKTMSVEDAMEKSNAYLEEMVGRFEEGLCAMVREGSDVFAFSFDLDPSTTTAPQTAIILIRPKLIADQMLAAIEYVRNSAVERDKQFNPAEPKAAKSIDPR